MGKTLCITTVIICIYLYYYNIYLDICYCNLLGLCVSHICGSNLKKPVKRLLPHTSQWVWNGWFLSASQAWGAARKVSKDDWLEWLRRLSVVLLKESSSPALRSCWSLAQTYIPLARYTTSDHLPLQTPFLLSVLFKKMSPCLYLQCSHYDEPVLLKTFTQFNMWKRVTHLHLLLCMLQFSRRLTINVKQNKSGIVQEILKSSTCALCNKVSLSPLMQLVHISVQVQTSQVLMCKYAVVDRDLFNAAFLSCWSELSEDQQDELIRSIELALTSQDIAEVTQTLLNLAEFMEHSDKVWVELIQFVGLIESYNKLSLLHASSALLRQK